MKASDILIGAAIVAVGYLAFRAMQPAPANPPASTTSSGGLLGKLLGSKTANDVGASVLSKISVWAGGSSSW